MSTIARESVFPVDRRFSTAAMMTACGLVLVLVAACLPAQAQQLQQLGLFNGSNGTNPNPRLVMDAAGNLYGTTFYGGFYGTFGPGTVFKLVHHDSGWTLTTLYEFHGHADGSNPWGGVILGPDGALYGATSGGGSYSAGLVYKLQPPSGVCARALCYWQETVLYNFTGGADGDGPQGDLAFDSSGNLYGTTSYGGQGYGLVYRLTHSQGGWNESVLYAFGGGADGGYPQDGVVLDQAGNVYGDSGWDGAYSFGVVYELSNNNGAWTETVLHSFAGGSDGHYPAGLTIDAAGNVYGETGEGGANNYGTVYQLQPANGGFNYNIIFNYGPDTGGPFPVTSLTADSTGDLYGCNVGGSNGAYGTAFKLVPAQGIWDFSGLYSFNEYQGFELNCKPLLDTQGDIFGTASEAGQDFDGTVWEITP
jgi:uncharacterized repeat protein (TIGR03803 family)